MISKDMYKFLKAAPRYPQKAAFIDLQKKHKWEINLYHALLEEAIDSHYIQFNSHQPRSLTNILTVQYSISEAGQIELEEYKKGKGSSIKSTVALIISGLSLIISAAPYIIKLLVQINN